MKRTINGWIWILLLFIAPVQAQDEAILRSQSPIAAYHLIKDAVIINRHPVEMDANGVTQQALHVGFGDTLGIKDPADTEALFRFAATWDAKFSVLDKRKDEIIASSRREVAAGHLLPPLPRHSRR